MKGHQCHSESESLRGSLSLRPAAWPRPGAAAGPGPGLGHSESESESLPVTLSTVTVGIRVPFKFKLAALVPGRVPPVPQAVGPVTVSLWCRLCHGHGPCEHAETPAVTRSCGPG